jgi:rifampicin phosphotransferase
MTSFTLPFNSPHSTLALTGGKGMNLAELVRAGFPVPTGFIVTTDAYRAFVHENQIQDRILAAVNAIAPDDPAALDSASSTIAALFDGGRISKEVAGAIALAYHSLSSSLQQPAAQAASHQLPVAVRSSATAEDLPGLSFAGQQDTYLNITGPAILDAVKKCWASLWTARAIAYRARNHIPPGEVTLAVVVQQMIASESSGVLFTANPLTGRRDEMVIDASFGLGEAIVQGIVEPDHYAVDTRSWTIATRRLGAKGLAIMPRFDGGVDEVRRDDSGQQALPDEQIVALARLAGRVADHFGSPQDIEWAWADGRLYLLQSRPITSLYPVPEVPVPPDATGVFFSFASIQGLTDPITPLGRDALRLFLGAVLLRVLRMQVNVRHAFADAGERIYLNFTEIARGPRSQGVMLAFMGRGDPAARQILVRLIEAGRLPLKRGAAHGPPGFLFHLIPRVLPRLLSALIAPEPTLRQALAVADTFTAEVRERVQELHRTGADLAARVALFELDVSRAFEHVFLSLIPAVFPAIAMITVIDRWLVGWCGAKPGSALALMRGLPGNVTTEMNLKLWEAARAIQADPHGSAVVRTRPIPELVRLYHARELPAAAQAEVEKFLNAYGMRAVAEIDFGRLRWRDDPASVFQTLQSYLGITDPGSAPDTVFRRGAAEAERLANAYVERAGRSPFGFVRAPVLKFAITRMRALGGARETPKFYIIKLLDIFRSLLLESGRDLAARGELEDAGDIFFVPLDTLKRFASGEAINLKEAVSRNRAEYEREQARRQVPRILLSTGEAFYEGLSDADAGPNDLAGEGVSPGLAEGVVRVVIDPRGTRLEPGEILVCPATDPGWTPLFLAAGGLVMEIGGMVTHGSVVAREYGIPAVVGVEAATTRLKTGQRVRVDGTVGRVTVLEQSG